MGRQSVPKGLVEIGGKPILWHVMQLYAAQGFDDFVLCLGWGADQVKDAFSGRQPFSIEFVDTGLDTLTAGRIRKVGHLIQGTFMATYQDGLARIDLNDLVRHHRSSGRIATITCARARLPFGLVSLDGEGNVTGFDEKPKLPDWVNGGFFVFERGVFDYLVDDTMLETKTFDKLVAAGQMTGYLLDEFWACMDTYKDALMLNELWEQGAPWKVWDRELV